MKTLLVVAIIAVFSSALRANADFFGADVLVLSQILTNSVQSLTELKSVVGTQRDTLNLMQEINRGINDSLNLLQTIGPGGHDSGVYRDWTRPDTALRGTESVYGRAAHSPEERVQKDADQSVAEAISLNNSVYAYTREVDDLGEAIKQATHDVSPGGAQKLTAESLGVMLHVMNQGLRTQATGLKVQAQTLAIQNRKDKEETKFRMDQADALNDSMHQMAAPNRQIYGLPRF